MGIRNRKILIIDDERDICFLLSGMLRPLTSEISFVNSLTDASRTLKSMEQKPDLIFMDINLPDGSGLDFIPTVKGVCPDAKVILISAYDTENDQKKANENGADMFVAKPFNKESIYAALEKLFSFENA